MQRINMIILCLFVAIQGRVLG